MRLERAMRRILLSTFAVIPALLLAALAIPAAALAAGPISTAAACSTVGTVVTCDLWARAGTLTVPGGSVTIWGFSDQSTGNPVVPGPDIVVTEGDSVNINLTNQLPDATSLVFDGVAMAPDLTSVAGLTGTHTYTFTAGDPGTYLY